MSPSIGSFGRSPAVMCRSLASRSIISSRSMRRLTELALAVAGAVIGAGGGRRALAIRDGGKRESGGSCLRPPPTALRRCLADDLLQRGDPLQDLEPAVHAEGQHSFVDRAVADLGGADVLDDELPDVRGHGHHFVETLAAIELRLGALVASGDIE